ISLARCRWCARSCRPSSSAAGRIRARHGLAPSSASCSPTSGALTADDCVQRAGGYGSASPSPSGSPRSAPSGRRCLPTPRCRCSRDRADRLASDCHARPRPSHPICGSACAPCPRRGGSCSRRSKPVCPMTRSLDPPMAHWRVRFVATWREEFFEAPILHNRNGIRTASWIWRADQLPRPRTKCVRFSTLNHDKLCLFKATEPRCLIFNQPASLMPTNALTPRADQPRFDGWTQWYKRYSYEQAGNTKSNSIHRGINQSPAWINYYDKRIVTKMCSDQQRAKKGRNTGAEHEKSQRGDQPRLLSSSFSSEIPHPGGSGGDGRNDKIGMADAAPFARREATARRCTDFTGQNSADATRKAG